MNSGSSALISSGGQSAETLSISSWYQRSRPSVQATLPPVCLTTSTWRTIGAPATALSALAFSGTLRPPRRPSSEVMTKWLSQSTMRSFRLSGEKPPKTIEWMAPMRVQASIA